jgi:hypothetical protein
MIKYDRVWAVELATSLVEDRARLVEQGESLSQIAASFLARHCETLALLRIVLSNGSATEIRALFDEAAAAFERVFALRGTTPPFRVIVTSQDPTELDAAELAAAEKAAAEKASTDESLTCSREGLHAVYLALAAGAFDRAQRLAREIWDPPDAEDSYLGEGSEVCTLAQQRLAYAVRELLLHHPATALAELRSLAAMHDEDAAEPMLQEQASAVEAIARGDAAAFRDALAALVDAHAQWAANPALARKPETIVCVPALALAAEAMRRGLATTADLPPSLPAALLPMAGS